MDKERDRNVKCDANNKMELLDPELRLQALYDNGTAIRVHHNAPLMRYYRSGIEMIRMADVYTDEGSYENAYTLYVKFMTIFLEKIREHPHYKTVPIKERATNKEMLRRVLPKAEALKIKLLERYRAEYARCLADAEQREKAEMERLARETDRRLKEQEDRRNKLISHASSSIGGREVKLLQPSAPPLFTNLATDFDEPLDPPADIDKKRPSIDRSTKPIPAAVASIRDKHGLRDVVLSNKIMRQFLELASNNTTSNKETCGILAGKLERDKLLVTHLLIPQQTGSPDSCATQNEEDIFDYQDQHNLITLGWIHTHPTQTAFLSSVDLHTHCAYQLMMAEAIAIVCAPKYDETGFFMLTPDYGLNFIAACRQTGFHPHPSEPQLYTQALHCKLSPTADIVLIDLRRK